MDINSDKLTSGNTRWTYKLETYDGHEYGCTKMPKHVETVKGYNAYIIRKIQPDTLWLKLHSYHHLMKPGVGL